MPAHRAPESRARLLGRSLAPGLLVAALAAAAGCRGEPTHFGSVVRIVDTEPEGRFARRSSFDETPTFRWGFSGRELADWEVANVDELLSEAGVARLRSAHPNRELTRDAGDLPAARVQVIDVQLQGLIGGRVALEWAAEGHAGFTARRRLVLRAENPSRTAWQHYRFLVGQHPEWRGTIRRIRLRLATPPDAWIALRSVEGIHRTMSAAGIAAAAGHPWKVELGNEMRNALVAPPGTRLRREIDVPPEGRLRFAWGLPRGTRAPPRFEVTITPPAAPPRVVFSVAPAPEAHGWHDEEVDLAAFGGQRVQLELGVGASPRYDLAAGLPAWGHPEVLGRRPGARPPNVILVSVDTLRADRLSGYGYERRTSPHLDAWAARRAVTFRQTVAASPWTVPSHLSMFTGLDAHRHGVNHPAPAPAFLDTIAERFRRTGYLTAAITGGAFMRPEMGMAQGFDLFRYWANRAASEDELATAVDGALAWARRHGDRPLFLFLHTYEVHSPYVSRQPYLERLTGRKLPDRAVSVGEVLLEKVGPPGTPRGIALHVERGLEAGTAPPGGAELIALASDLYDSGIGFADAQLGRLLQGLEPAAPGAVVAITSDHGEMMGEHELVSHHTLYDENLLVPLLVAAADGRGAGRQVAAQVRQVDVLPTLLALAGLPAAEAIDGVSLEPLMRGRRAPPTGEAWSYAAVTQRGLALRLDGRLKYVFNDTAWPRFQGGEALYRLGPAGDEPLAGDPARLSSLRRKVVRRLDRDVPGLRIGFVNRSVVPLAGTLAGKAIVQEQVKSWDLACRCLELDADGTLRFVLPPRTRFTIHLGAVEAGTLELAVAGTASAVSRPRRASFRLDAARRPQSLVFDGSRWYEAAEPRDTAAAAVWLRWQHPSAVDEPQAKIEQLLEDDLRALGYVG